MVGGEAMQKNDRRLTGKFAIQKIADLAVGSFQPFLLRRIFIHNFFPPERFFSDRKNKLKLYDFLHQMENSLNPNCRQFDYGQIF